MNIEAQQVHIKVENETGFFFQPDRFSHRHSPDHCVNPNSLIVYNHGNLRLTHILQVILVKYIIKENSVP